MGNDAAAAPAHESTDNPLTPVETTLAGATKILRTYGFNATADLAAEKATAGQVQRTVVVVGELNRGKSSLVNALAGIRGLSPVDVDPTTSATMSVVADSAEHPWGSADLVFPGAVRRIPVAEVADWVSAAGRHVTDPAVEVLPTRAIVPVRSPHLANLILVDTPGSGGLDAAAAKLSAQSAEQAGVLVVVCDASSPLTAPEMNFIRDCTATVEAVIVVVTKTDKHLRRWKLIVEENQRLLRTHLRRTIPVVGVSSVRALAAVEITDPVRRSAAEASSGITALRTLIGSALDSDHRAQVDGLRTAREGLRLVHGKVTAHITRTKDGDAALPELEAQRDQLTALTEQSAQWDQHLGRDLTLARQAAVMHLEEQLDVVKEKWTTKINASGMEVLRKNPQVFTSEIESDLLAAMTSAVQLFLDRLRGIVTPLFGSESETVWRSIESEIVASMQSDPLTTGQVVSKKQGLLDPSVLTMGMIGTSMLGALIGVGAIAGVVWIGVNLGYKAMRAGKTNLLTWLRETVATAKVSTARMLDLGLALSRPEIVIRYREHLKSSIAQVQSQIAQAQDAQRLDAATRDSTLKKLNTNLRVVTAKSSEIENLIARLTTPPPAPTPESVAEKVTVS
ncbi:dynamin family protein [Rhodococcus sp. ARC_M6]|uniref:dynamin family protein n=1 Tax=Rhodococcus sp. ARC_M6 TaxID=2928852 RepID=UPI001FB3B46F|nr:dynamin family protein [Rhodococcus sp. ARC_M6]MCJ0907112.1 dynamin family protein [Rhodococcus sp. ARC_M6]